MDLEQACRQIRNKSSSITLLNLSCQCLGNDGVMQLLGSCSSSGTICRYRNAVPSLVVLWLESNEIYKKGALALTRLIAASPSLKYLYLAHNCIGSQGAAEIASNAFCKLEVCDLADNEIDKTGANLIADVISSKKITVQRLVLESNRLGDQGAIALAESLKHNKTLEFLDIRFNRIGEAGIRAFRDVLLKDNKTLKHLWLEEEDQCCSDCKPPERAQKRPMLERTKQCNSQRKTCQQCKLRNEIDYYLALNRGGRHSFGNDRLSVTLWPRVISRVSKQDPTMMYVLLSGRPDVLKR